MRRTLAALVTALLLAVGVVLSQGPLTPFAMLRGRTDANGALRVEGQAYSGTQGPLTNLANLRVRTDSNGSLLVSIAGGDITPDTITFPTGGAVRTGTTASDTFLLQGYDTNTGPAYVTLATVTAGTTPTIAIPAITGATTFSSHVSLLSDAGLLYFGASSDNAIGRADASSLYVSKGLHVGGTSAVADNNLLVDGTVTVPTLYGTSADNGDITIEGTSSATKTTSYVVLQPTSGNVGVGTATPGTALHVLQAGTSQLNLSDTSTNYAFSIGYDDNGATTAYLRNNTDIPSASIKLGFGTSDKLTITEAAADADTALTFVGKATVGGTLTVSGAAVTAGSGTGVTVNSTAQGQRVIYKVTVAKEHFIAAAVTQDLTIATLPAKTRLVGMYLNISEVFALAASQLTLTCGTSAGGNQLLVAIDADAATGWFGDADGELGASINAAGRVQDAYIASFSATQIVSIRLASDSANLGTGAATSMTTGSMTLYLITEILP